MRTLLKRSWLLLATAGALASFPLAAGAQEYPTKQVRFITNAGPGTPADLILRVVGEEVRKTLGQPVIVESKVGGGGVIAYNFVAKEAPADGYTFLLGNLPLMALFPLTVKNLQFNPTADLTPVTGVAELPLAWASQPDSPWKNFDEMVAYIKARPDQMFYADTSVFTRVWTEGFLGRFGLKVTRVPYSNQADSYRDLTVGTINVQFAPLGTLQGLERGDKRPLIMAITGQQRDPALPDIPTVGELGAPELAVGGNFTLVARTGTPQVAIDKMRTAVVQALNQADVQAALKRAGVPVLVRTPEQLQTVLAQLVETFTGIAKRINLQPE
jgi:tripartite-type tricarboxylate transporter receptor subunit TctC